ncbi:MAG: hypothetical protein FRX49_12191 [Trebouxia sp. A1-2]|nr:MAG: hypothetical protein FRX49_12191 [Trebouxia sp. A1-2]
MGAAVTHNTNIVAECFRVVVVVPDNLEIPIISRLYTAAKEQANWQYTSWVGIHIQGDWLISNWIASHEGFEHNYELTTCKGQFLGIMPGKKALRVCKLVCNSHLIPENRFWAGKSPCCLAPTLASFGLSPVRSPLRLRPRRAAACGLSARSYLSSGSELPDAMLSASSSLKSTQIRERSGWLQIRGLTAQLHLT